MRRLSLMLLLALVSGGLPAHGHEVETQCRFTALANHVLAPVDLTFGIPAGSISARVVIDAEAGRFTLDGASMDVPPYDMPFSEARDSLDFADEEFAGVIDQSGEIVVPDVRFVICTGGTPDGTDCVPGNLCADPEEPSIICIKAAGGGIGCPAGVPCQGVCAGARSRTCATDADCGTGDRCGDGFLVPFTVTLTSGAATFKDLVKRGTPLDFQTGAVMLTSLGPTARESPVIQDNGITSIELGCRLDEVPAVEELPAAPTLAVGKAKIKLGKGAPGAADDLLKLKAVFTPRGGSSIDPAVDDLSLQLGARLRACDGSSKNAGQACQRDDECELNDEVPAGTVARCVLQEKILLDLVIPAGRLTPSKKGTGFTAADASGTCAVDSSSPGEACVSDAGCGRGACERIRVVQPQGAPGEHTVTLKRSKKGALKLSVTSTGLDLDGLSIDALTSEGGSVASVTARLGVGVLQGATVSRTPRGNKKGLTF